MQTIATRVGEEIKKDLEEMIKIEHIDKSTAIRKAIEIGIHEWKKDYVLKMLRENKITVAKAAKLLKISICEIIQLMEEHEVSIPIKAEHIIEDIEAALK